MGGELVQFDSWHGSFDTAHVSSLAASGPCVCFLPGPLLFDKSCLCLKAWILSVFPRVIHEHSKWKTGGKTSSVSGHALQVTFGRSHLSVLGETFLYSRGYGSFTTPRAFPAFSLSCGKISYNLEYKEQAYFHSFTWFPIKTVLFTSLRFCFILQNCILLNARKSFLWNSDGDIGWCMIFPLLLATVMSRRWRTKERIKALFSGSIVHFFLPPHRYIDIPHNVWICLYVCI